MTLDLSTPRKKVNTATERVAKPAGGEFAMLKMSLADSLGTLARDKVEFLRFLEQADFDVGLYRPADVDKQTPHVRDELYVVAAGSGEFVCEGESTAVATGDAIFVGAGKQHRFASFTPDFCAWVIFFGQRP